MAIPVWKPELCVNLIASFVISRFKTAVNGHQCCMSCGVTREAEHSDKCEPAVVLSLQVLHTSLGANGMSWCVTVLNLFL